MSVEVVTSHADTSQHEPPMPTTTIPDDQQEPVTKDSGLLLNNRKYCQDSSSDNKSTSIILKKKVIKKPPPLFIDIQNKRSLDDLQQAHNNTAQQNNITSPLKSPSSSIRVMDLGPLDNDEQFILEEEIKARRLARRQHKKTYADDDDEDEDEDFSRTTIGTRVAEGHRNYQMMYDMLTGIRIAVGRVSAKIQRDLTPEDFTAAHKLVFDV